MPYHVHKFGGTSMKDIPLVADIIINDLGKEEYKGIVASAQGGVTNKLIAMLEAASAQQPAPSTGVKRSAASDDNHEASTAAAYEVQLDAIIQSHKDEVSRLVGNSDEKTRLYKILDSDRAAISNVLTCAHSLRRHDEAMIELVSGYGEIWSTLILHAYLFSHYGVKSLWLNARDVLFVDHDNVAGRTVVNWILSGEKFQAWKVKNNADSVKLIIITGYIATECGTLCPTTLKRNGSDFSGTIFGKLLNAARVSIWTDVDGVYTCDPRQAAAAVMLPYLSFEEACELANFGAKVVHPSTMGPAMDLRHSFSLPTSKDGERCGHNGTVIYKKAVTEGDFPLADLDANVLGLRCLKSITLTSIRGFAMISDVALVTVQASTRSRHAFSSLAEVLFKALSDNSVKVVLATQSCNQLLFRFGVKTADANAAKKCLDRALFREIFDGEIDTVNVTLNCAVVAAVGDGVDTVAGISGVFFGALGHSGVNILLIGGSAERSVSAVIESSDSQRAMEALHAIFYPKVRREQLKIHPLAK